MSTRLPSAPNRCPVCSTALNDPYTDYGEKLYFNCPRCGLFGLTRSADAILPSLLTTARRRGVLSYAIRRTPSQGRDTPLFGSDLCKKIIESDFLPSPQEQAENLLRWLGENLSGPGETARIVLAEHGPIIGAQSEAGLDFVVGGLLTSGLLLGKSLARGVADVTLSFAGWERFEQLRRGTPVGRKAFIAMQYNNPILTSLVNDHFRAAVKETGFDLRRLDDEAPAGLIDDRLRVEIQSSRFLIVDLTDRNPGAYWEAGYAEGLGKPVIYTCEESKFHEASHFDTNHHLHVLWTENDPGAAVRSLKATIRATIPEASRE